MAVNILHCVLQYIYLNLHRTSHIVMEKNRWNYILRINKAQMKKECDESDCNCFVELAY